jgi:ferredoxin-NADP reductase
MEGTAVRRRLNWQTGTVEGFVPETSRTRSIVLAVPGWSGHRAGQHVDVRLTAEDGYQAQRSYSIASAPEDEHLVLTVERLDNGEVSPFLVDELRTGDELELRGPIGGYFVWESAHGGDPLFLVAGGSGVVPFRSMMRHHRASGSAVPVRLLYSARSLPDVVYRDELTRINGNGEIDIRFVLTREQPRGWRGYRRRIDQELLAEVAWPPTDRPLVYVCGPTDFVETAASALVALGHEAGRIRLERFGGTGGSA